MDRRYVMLKLDLRWYRRFNRQLLSRSIGHVVVSSRRRECLYGLSVSIL